MDRIFLLIAVAIPLTTSYFVGPNKLTWDQAERYCQEQGSHLASFHSDQELNAARDLLDARDIDEAHVGLRLANVWGNNKWVWVDCSSSSYGFKVNGEPESGLPWLKDDWDGCNTVFCFQWASCVSLDLKSRGHGIDDIQCQNERYPVCNGEQSCD
eukprot:218461_1